MATRVWLEYPDGVDHGMKMIQLNLADDEVLTLREVLESYLSDLRMEIADTDQMGFREKLKQDEVILKKIIEALKQ